MSPLFQMKDPSSMIISHKGQNVSFSQMFSFHCSTLNTKTWDQQAKQDTPTIYSYNSEPPGPHWLLISWNFPFYLASNLNIFLSFDKTDSVTQKSVPRIFFFFFTENIQTPVIVTALTIFSLIVTHKCIPSYNFSKKSFVSFI